MATGVEAGTRVFLVEEVEVGRVVCTVSGV